MARSCPAPVLWEQSGDAVAMRRGLGRAGRCRGGQGGGRELRGQRIPAQQTRDTRAVQTTREDRSGNVAQANRILVFAECASSLKIMVNKVLGIVQ